MENMEQADAAPARGPPTYNKPRRKCPSGYKKLMGGGCRKKNEPRRSYRRMKYRT